MTDLQSPEDGRMSQSVDLSSQPESITASSASIATAYTARSTLSQTTPSFDDVIRNIKIDQVKEACDRRDVEALISLAVSEKGLVNDELRKIAWPLLLGCSDTKESAHLDEKAQSWQALPDHRDENQVRLDVDRSFIYYPKQESPRALDRRKTELSNLITAILRLHPSLCYFQGYHDICQVFLLVLGPELALPAAAHLSLLRIRDFMLPSLSPALAHLHLLPSILLAQDPALWKHLSLSLTKPFFALAATLTLYAHDIQSYRDIARLFDVLLAREAVFSVYLFAQIVLDRKPELLDIPPSEPEMLHSILSKLPQPLDLESLIIATQDLLFTHPPPSLPAWRSISPYSVLKTTLPTAELQGHHQSLADGERLLQKQAAQIRRAERRDRALAEIWKYRRPTGAVGLAMLVGVMSWWLGRRNGVVGGIGVEGVSLLEGLLLPLFKRGRLLWTGINP